MCEVGTCRRSSGWLHHAQRRVATEERGSRIRVTFPQKYRVGHEAHFAQVTERFLEYMKNPKSMPAWEKANMLAKYYVTTKGVELSKK